MGTVFTHVSKFCSLLAIPAMALFLACSGDETVATPGELQNLDFESIDTSTTSIDSIREIINDAVPEINIQVIDSMLNDTNVSKQEIIDSMQSIVEIFISSAAMWTLSSSSTAMPQSSATEQPYSSENVAQSSSIAEQALPNNGIPYIKITVNDSAALSDTSVVGVYYDCFIQVAGNGQYDNIGINRAQIRMRGNSTRLWYPKKPYRIKFDNKVSMLGLPANKDWVLLANYRDPTHYMNAVIFDMARYMGSFDFVNANRFVELEINGDYKGMYQLTEQIERATSRVNIEETGYLLALDADDGPDLSPNETNNFWSSVYKLPVAVKYPKNPDATALETIKADFASLEQAIADGNFLTVQQLLDVNSFIDFILIQEISHNVELEAPRSMFLHKKEAGGKFFFGPVWDFDGGFAYMWDEEKKEYFENQKWILSSKNPSTSPYNCTAANQNDWGMCKSSGNAGGFGGFGGGNSWDGWGASGFFTNLFGNEEFLAAYKARWNAIKGGLLNDAFAKLDTYANTNAKAMANDAARWEWPSKKNNTGKSYDAAIANMKDWLTTRVNSYTSVVEGY